MSMEFYDPVPMPAVADFSFKSILKHVQPQVDAVTKDINDLVSKYQDGLSEELIAAASLQDTVTAKMAHVDQLAAKCASRASSQLSKAESSSRLKKELDTLVSVSNEVHSNVTALLDSFKSLDLLLPPADRLSNADSPHRSHYPHLHHELLKYTPPPSHDCSRSLPSSSYVSSSSTTRSPSYEWPPQPRLRSQSSSVSLVHSQHSSHSSPFPHDHLAPHSYTVMNSLPLSGNISTKAAIFQSSAPTKSAKDRLANLIKR